MTVAVVNAGRARKPSKVVSSFETPVTWHAVHPSEFINILRPLLGLEVRRGHMTKNQRDNACSVRETGDTAT